jgi:hypothetical protein
MNLPWDAERLVREVEELLRRAGAQTDLLVQSDYAKYAVIRISGLLEQAVTEVVQTHVKAQASPTVIAHTEWRMATFQNPTVERLLQLVGSFDRRWRLELDGELTQAERGALGSITAQRNKVAHGQDSTISLAQVSQYFDEVKNVLTKVAARF